MTWQQLTDGLDFGEGPRWHDGRLWYSDFHQHRICSVDAAGDHRVEHGDLEDRPSGLGWLPDGRLLVVFMSSRRLMRDDGSGLVVHADLSEVAAHHCNDMVVSATGNAYVGNFGFDLDARAPFAPADLALVRPDGTVSVAAEQLRFPNGSVITPDGATLVVAETMGAGFVAFTIGSDGTLSDRRRWASVEGTSPDGCCLDAGGGIWFADALGTEVIRVEEGGAVTDRITTPMPAYACMLGGADGRTLHAMCAPDFFSDAVAGKGAGVIFTTTVEHPHAGNP